MEGGREVLGWREAEKEKESEGMREERIEREVEVV